MNETKELAQCIAEISYTDLNDDVIEKAKGLILDQLGCQLSFSQMPWSRTIYEYIKDCQSGCSDSTITYYGLKTSMENAAYANAVFGHGFEMDDTEFHSVTHPGSVIVPAALATGEKEMVSGKDLLVAIVVGYDTMIRIGTAAKTMMQRGFQPTAATGSFGAVAATGKILCFNSELIVNALGIVGSDTSGISEWSESGGSVKRLHAALAAQAGIRAALLAGRGFTGPSTILEGRKGFCQAYANEFSLKAITEGLGREFRILWTGNKPYCCCAAQHSAIDATAAILQKHEIPVEQIDKIIAGAPAREIKSVGSITEPHDMTSAQFSGSFGIALRVIKGSNGYEAYTDENLKNGEILNLAKKVKFVVDDELENANITGAPARVTIKLKDGTVFQERVDYAKGTINNPMTKDELSDKFRGLASMVLPGKHVEEIIQLVDTLDEVDDIRKLGELLISRN